MKRFFVYIMLAFSVIMSGCSDADIASKNISKMADNFEVNRRIVFYNGITGEYMLTMQGLCSLGNSDQPNTKTITCKVGPNEYKKHFLGLSDNVTYFVEQIDSNKVDPYHYVVMFKPQSIIPDIRLK